MIRGWFNSCEQVTSMASFGENLRREREMRGVTLEEISTATKITVRSLQALEADDFSKLPGGIFTRGFIRSYLKYLGLDEEAAMAEFQSIAPKIPDPDLSSLAANKQRRAPEGSRGRMAGLLVGVLLLIGGFALYRYAHRMERVRATAMPAQIAPGAAGSQPQPGNPSQSSAAASNQASEESEPPAEPPAAAEGSQLASGAGPAPGTNREAGRVQTAALPASESIAQSAKIEAKAQADGELVLQVAATEPSWVRIVADGKTSMDRVLNPNEIRTLRAKDSFDVTTGNAQGTILTLNGETMKPLGRRGEVKTLHITHDDLKNPSP